MEITIYGDGSSGSKGKCAVGWAWLVLLNGKSHIFNSRRADSGTNNTAELMSLIDGLKAIETLFKVGDTVVLCSDSRYALGIANGSYTPHKNVELAVELKALTSKYGASTQWVKGHGTDKHNILVDKLARFAKNMYTDPTKEQKKKRKRELRKITE